MSMSIAEAKSQFSAVVDRAAAGEETVITRHGTPVAKIVPLHPDRDAEGARHAFEALLGLQDGATLGGLTTKDLVEEGRM
ncbi:MAG TPA: type II toxin-antitoxin system prevent-host-death family antitoxin [Devosia sp.]|jgi:prevent-host-death family protein|nr:type II toxin-antitoxin system prevent-host-death family antitoxin [Devosia sp.]